MSIITDCVPDFHLPQFPPYKHRVLYAGNDLAMLKRLRATFTDCRIVDAPAGSVARLFIREIEYSLLLFAHELPDTTGTKLAHFTRALPRRKHDAAPPDSAERT